MRNDYWVWKDDILKRVTVHPWLYTVNKNNSEIFTIQGEPESQFVINSLGLAKTKKLALERKEEMKKYKIRRF